MNAKAGNGHATIRKHAGRDHRYVCYDCCMPIPASLGSPACISAPFLAAYERVYGLSSTAQLLLRKSDPPA